MAFHQAIQNVLLTGARLPAAPAAIRPHQPAALLPLIDAVAQDHDRFNRQAVDYGHRYRSSFWAIYLLVALAVLCAGLPSALGWDSAQNPMHSFSVIWVVSELVIIVLVGLIYWRGQRLDWQGQWLAARTRSELAWYLPLIAPLVNFSDTAGSANWYAHLGEPALDLPAGDDFDAVCRTHRTLACKLVDGIWSDPLFIGDYARWVVDILEGQRRYHQHVALRQHALQHRVHAMTAWLFGMTGLAALTHLVIHSNVLTLAAMFFPALGASLHGALAQSEAYRLEATSRRLVIELGQIIEPVRHTLLSDDPLVMAPLLRDAVLSAVAVILDEHRDWHMLVRQHRMPLG